MLRFQSAEDADLLDRARVTVVNDDPEFLAMVGEVLTEEHYAVTLIDVSEPDPLGAIARSDPHLLVIDLRLGSDELRGWQVLQSVRATAAGQTLPVLVLSGDVQALTRLETELAGLPQAVALAKPFGLGELSDAVTRLLTGSRHD